MTQGLLSSLRGRLLISLAIGILVVSAANAFAYLVMRIPFAWEDEYAVIIFQIVIVSLPFIIISLTGARSPAPWVAGLGMTVALWGFYVFDAWSSRGSGEGANIGLGLLMLMSPVVISAVCMAIAKPAAARTPARNRARPGSRAGSQ